MLIPAGRRRESDHFVLISLLGVGDDPSSAAEAPVMRQQHGGRGGAVRLAWVYFGPAMFLKY